MDSIIGVGIIYLIAAWFFFWWPFNGGLLPISKYEDVNVNVYFYDSDNKEIYLGEMKGASACQSATYSYARQHNIDSSDWSYICCTIRKDSSCYEKIK